MQDARHLANQSAPSDVFEKTTRKSGYFWALKKTENTVL
jgi:hypothetical protein